MPTRSLLPAAMLLAGCSLHHQAAAPEPARDPARDSLFRLDQTRGDSIAARGPVDGRLALLSPDVVYLRAGVPVVYGREGARALFIASSTLAGQPVSDEPLGGGVSNDLRSAFTFGVTARAAPPNAAPKLDRYIAYWERAPGQPWRIAAYSEIGAPRAVEVSVAHEFLAPPERRPTQRMAEGIARLRAADSLFSDVADRMGTAFAFSDAIAADGVVVGSVQLVIGPKAVHDFYVARDSALTWHPAYADVASSLDMGFTVGEYSSTSRGPSGAAVQRFGKYLRVWKRQGDGTWKFVVDGGNTTPVPER